MFLFPFYYFVLFPFYHKFCGKFYYCNLLKCVIIYYLCELGFFNSDFTVYLIFNISFGSIRIFFFSRHGETT